MGVLCQGDRVASAGWYPDPQDNRRLRWWDGVTWTTHTADRPVLVAAAAGWHGIGPALQEEQALTPWARAVVVVYPILAVVNGLTVWASGPRWHTYLHWLRLVIEHPDTARALPRPPALVSPWVYVVDAVELALQIVFLIWQYRAAVVARHLGYPARRSPGWGVGSWFVPVVGLWMPYQAIRDCLPPGHEARGLVLRTWLSLIGGAVLALAMPITFFWGTGWGWYLEVALVLVELVVVTTAFRVVVAIDAQHRAAALATAGGRAPE